MIKEVLDALPNGSAITFSADQLEVLFLDRGPVLASTKTAATIIEGLAHTCGCSFALHGDTGTFTKSLTDTAASAQMNLPRSPGQIGFEDEREDKMFGKSNGNSHEEDRPLPPIQQLQNCARQMRIVLDSVFHGDHTELYDTYGMAGAQVAVEDIDDQMARRQRRWRREQLAPTHLAALESAASCSIGPGVTVVGKISSEGIVNVFGRVEGELHASVVWVSDGAKVEGAIVAQELTIGGRFNGTIQANRVTLTSSAVVEGEIYYRSLVIEENAWFAGGSHPEEASASGTDARSTIEHVSPDGNQQVNGSLAKEAHADTANRRVEKLSERSESA